MITRSDAEMTDDAIRINDDAIKAEIQHDMPLKIAATVAAIGLLVLVLLSVLGS